MQKELIENTSHWQNLSRPLSPNENEVAVFQQLIASFSPVYMLGMTKELAFLCDVAVDLAPVNIGKPSLRCDWHALTGIRAGAIIGDGVINLAGMELVDKMLALCDRFICRVFLKKIPGMKYATHFPASLPGATMVIPTQKNIVIAVWDKRDIVR